jgi:hypothetical protein
MYVLLHSPLKTVTPDYGTMCRSGDQHGSNVYCSQLHRLTACHANLIFLSLYPMKALANCVLCIGVLRGAVNRHVGHT